MHSRTSLKGASAAGPDSPQGCAVSRPTRESLAGVPRRSAESREFRRGKRLCLADCEGQLK